MQAFLAHGGQTCTIAGTLGASNRVHRSMLLPLPRFNADKRLEAIAEVPPRLVQGAGPCFASALLTEKLGAMASAEWQSRVVSSDVRTLAAQARVLCVGAGGIGCELLKTLVLSGFKDITVVDLDTIETSNMNRQFLFRKHHVGHAKAQVAGEAAARMRPGVKIEALQANIKESRFGVDWFRGFRLVLNGLDNLDARRHVNRMCLAAGVPLLESGTNGYQGQALVHVKGETECFECAPHAAPKTFPICTIRNTPDRPIHCVVWAKELLFSRLFGPQDQVTDLDERDAAPAASEPAAAAAEGEPARGADGEAGASNGGAEEPGGSGTHRSVFLRGEGEGAVAFARRVFRRVYGTDIERVLRMEDLWKARSKPRPLDIDVLVPEGEDGAPALSGALRELCRKTQQPWTDAESARVFLACVWQYHEGPRSDQLGAAVFDKDDDVAVAFVTAASNLRASCYGIPKQGLFECKGMAGNIIHAIATTNAIVAGLMTIEALKVLAGVSEHCKWTSLSPASEQRPRFRGKLLQAVPPPKPRPGCIACGKAEMLLRVNTETATLGDVVSKVAKGRLGLARPFIDCDDTDLLYEEGSDLDEDELDVYKRRLSMPLARLPKRGVRGGSVMVLQDHMQDFDVRLRVEHVAVLNNEEFPEGFELTGEAPKAHVPAERAGHGGDRAGPSGAGPCNALIGDGDDDDLEVVVNGAGHDSDDDLVIVGVQRGLKRGREGEGEGAGDDKRARA